MESFPDTKDGAIALMHHMFEEVVAAKLVTMNIVPDPSADGVWGVQDAAGTVRAVLYVNDCDVTVDDLWLMREGVWPAA